MTLDEAIKKAKKECKNPYAQTYLNAIPEAIEFGGELGGEAVHSLKIQLLYALNNMRGWRSETAREVKKVMKKYAEAK